MKTRLLTVAAVAVLALVAAPTASAAPSANVSASGQPYRGETITFTASGFDLLFGPVTYSWSSLPDGCTPNGNVATCSFGSLGTRTARVDVTNSIGETTSAEDSITIVNRPPTVGISPTSTTAFVGQIIGFTASGSDPDGGFDTLIYEWDLNGDGNFTDQVSTAATAPASWSQDGAKIVRVRAFDGTSRSPAATANITVTNRKPIAKITAPVTTAAIGQPVTVSALPDSVDPDGYPLTYTWDLNDDGTFGDATGPSPAALTFFTAGKYRVALEVEDPQGKTAQTFVDITVLNEQPPVSAFSFAPSAPLAGQQVAFTSSSSDPNGTIAKSEWDFDNDGQFDDATGANAQWTFASAGAYIVSLRVTDDKGVAAVSFQTMTVGSIAGPPVTGASTTPPPSTTAARPTLLSPFPIVRIRGRAFGLSVRIDVFSVRAPKGSRIRVKCTGRSCPYRNSRKTVRSGAKSVRFTKLEKRLRPGTLIQVFVTKAGRIGKYTRFKIRSGAAPSRRDLCLTPGKLKPGRCPS